MFHISDARSGYNLGSGALTPLKCETVCTLGPSWLHLWALGWSWEAIFALPSITSLQKSRFRVEGVHQRGCRNAHPPHENAIFATKWWKVVQKSPLRDQNLPRGAQCKKQIGPIKSIWRGASWKIRFDFANVLCFARPKTIWLEASNTCIFLTSI